MGAKDFGRNLRYVRKQRGMTQRALGEAARLRRKPMTPSYVCRIEAGKLDPRLSTVHSFARALKVPAWQLLADIEHPSGWYVDYLSLSGEQKRHVQWYIGRLAHS